MRKSVFQFSLKQAIAVVVIVAVILGASRSYLVGLHRSRLQETCVSELARAGFEVNVDRRVVFGEGSENSLLVVESSSVVCCVGLQYAVVLRYCLITPEAAALMKQNPDVFDFARFNGCEIGGHDIAKGVKIR